MWVGLRHAVLCYRGDIFAVLDASQWLWISGPGGCLSTLSMTAPDAPEVQGANSSIRVCGDASRILAFCKSRYELLTKKQSLVIQRIFLWRLLSLQILGLGPLHFKVSTVDPDPGAF